MSSEKTTNVAYDFEAVIARIKRVKGVREDAEVAAILGFKPSAFSIRKKRDSLPLKEIKFFAVKEGISYEWLVTGKGEMAQNQTATPSRAREEDSELARLLNRAKMVLTSGNPVARDALAKNIEYFAHTIEKERELEELKQSHKNLEDRMAILEKAFRDREPFISDGESLDEKAM